MKLVSVVLLGLAASALVGCGGEDCRVETIDVPFELRQNPAGLRIAEVVTDRCGGEGTEELRYEVSCSGNCPVFTARVFLDSYMIAETDAFEPYAQIVAHESTTPDINEYQLYVEADPAVPVDSYVIAGTFTGSRAQTVP